MPARLTLIALAACLILSGGVLSGCNEARLIDNPGNNREEADEADETDEAEETNEEPSTTAEEGHGPDDDAELLEPGQLTGSWRLKRTDNGDPVVHFSLIQAAGETEADGSFMMRYGMDRWFEGRSGEIRQATLEGDRARVVFNPTDNAEQRFIVEVTSQTPQRWTGHLWAKLDPTGEKTPVEMLPLNREPSE